MDAMVQQHGVPRERRRKPPDPAEANKTLWEQTLAAAREKTFDFWEVEYEVPSPAPVDPWLFKTDEEHQPRLTPDDLFEAMLKEYQEKYQKTTESWYVPDNMDNLDWWMDYIKTGTELAKRSAEDEDVDNPDGWSWDWWYKAYLPWNKSTDIKKKCVRYPLRAAKRQDLLEWSRLKTSPLRYNQIVNELKFKEGIEIHFTYHLNEGRDEKGKRVVAWDFHSLQTDWDELKRVFPDQILVTDYSNEQKLANGGDYHISLMLGKHPTQKRNEGDSEEERPTNRDNLLDRIEVIKEKFKDGKVLYIPRMYCSSTGTYMFYMPDEDWWKNYDRTEDFQEIASLVKDAYKYDKPGVDPRISWD
jgi:hypothetical protein